VSTARWIPDEIAGPDLKNLSVPGHFSHAGQYQVKLLFGAGMGVGAYARARRKLGQVDEVAASSQTGAIDDSGKPDQPFAVVGAGIDQVDPIEVISVEEALAIHTRPSSGLTLRDQGGWSRPIKLKSSR
jgi:hypothetical protein